MSYFPAFQPQPFGPVVVPTPGQPVQLTTELLTLGLITALTDLVVVNKVSIFPLPANQGNVYIGTKGMVKATLAGVIWVLVPGGAFPIKNDVGLNIYHFDQWYVDADNMGEGVGGSIDQV